MVHSLPCRGPWRHPLRAAHELLLLLLLPRLPLPLLLCLLVVSLCRRLSRVQWMSSCLLQPQPATACVVCTL